MKQEKTKRQIAFDKHMKKLEKAYASIDIKSLNSKIEAKLNK